MIDIKSERFMIEQLHQVGTNLIETPRISLLWYESATV